MLKINFEVIPFGIEDEAYSIEELFIWNTKEEKDGYYKYRWCWGERPNPGVLPDEMASVYPNHVWHRRDKGAIKLVRQVLNAS